MPSTVPSVKEKQWAKRNSWLLRTDIFWESAADTKINPSLRFQSSGTLRDQLENGKCYQSKPNMPWGFRRSSYFFKRHNQEKVQASNWAWSVDKTYTCKWGGKDGQGKRKTKSKEPELVSWPVIPYGQHLVPRRKTVETTVRRVSGGPGLITTCEALKTQKEMISWFPPRNRSLKMIQRLKSTLPNSDFAFPWWLL